MGAGIGQRRPRLRVPSVFPSVRVCFRGVRVCFRGANAAQPRRHRGSVSVGCREPMVGFQRMGAGIGQRRPRLRCRPCREPRTERSRRMPTLTAPGDLRACGPVPASTTIGVATCDPFAALWIRALPAQSARQAVTTPCDPGAHPFGTQLPPHRTRATMLRRWRRGRAALAPRRLSRWVAILRRWRRGRTALAPRTLSRRRRPEGTHPRTPTPWAHRRVGHRPR